MVRIALIFISLIMISGCSQRSGLWKNPGSYLGGSEAAGIEIACNKRGSGARDSMAWQLCVQSQKVHYR